MVNFSAIIGMFKKIFTALLQIFLKKVRLNINAIGVVLKVQTGLMNALNTFFQVGNIGKAYKSGCCSARGNKIQRRYCPKCSFLPTNQFTSRNNRLSIRLTCGWIFKIEFLSNIIRLSNVIQRSDGRDTLSL